MFLIARTWFLMVLEHVRDDSSFLSR